MWLPQHKMRTIWLPQETTSQKNNTVHPARLLTREECGYHNASYIYIIIDTYLLALHP